jgi:hypothetical protein
MKQFWSNRTKIFEEFPHLEFSYFTRLLIFINTVMVLFVFLNVVYLMIMQCRFNYHELPYLESLKFVNIESQHPLWITRNENQEVIFFY